MLRSLSTAGILLLTDMFSLSCRYFCHSDAHILPGISRTNFSSDDTQRKSSGHAQSRLAMHLNVIVFLGSYRSTVFRVCPEPFSTPSHQIGLRF